MHGRWHGAIQQCSRSFTKSERTHDRMKPNMCSKRSCMMVVPFFGIFLVRELFKEILFYDIFSYNCLYVYNIHIFTSVCGKTRCHFYVHVSFYQIIWVQCCTSIDKSQKHYLLRIFGRICRSTPVERARQELKLKLGHKLLFTKEIFNIKPFHLAMKDLQ